MNSEFKNKLINLPNQSFYVLYKEEKYLVTKNIIAKNNVVKLYAIRLSSKDIVSCNYYINIKGGLLKPCEMTNEKVIDFILFLKIIT